MVGLIAVGFNYLKLTFPSCISSYTQTYGIYKNLISNVDRGQMLVKHSRSYIISVDWVWN